MKLDKPLNLRFTDADLAHSAYVECNKAAMERPGPPDVDSLKEELKVQSLVQKAQQIEIRELKARNYELILKNKQLSEELAIVTSKNGSDCRASGAVIENRT